MLGKHEPRSNASLLWPQISWKADSDQCQTALAVSGTVRMRTSPTIGGSVSLRSLSTVRNFKSSRCMPSGWSTLNLAQSSVTGVGETGNTAVTRSGSFRMPGQPYTGYRTVPWLNQHPSVCMFRGLSLTTAPLATSDLFRPSRYESEPTASDEIRHERLDSLSGKLAGFGRGQVPDQGLAWSRMAGCQGRRHGQRIKR